MSERNGAGAELKFWEIIASSNLACFALELAANDPAMVALQELHAYGTADTVRTGRARRLKRERPAQLQDELLQTYGLTQDEARQALGLCLLELAYGEGENMEWTYMKQAE